MFKKDRIRSIVQIVFFAFILAVTVLTALNVSWVNASLHAICPFGGVVSIYNFVTVGTFVQKIHSSSFILMLIVFASAILFGPVFCGWICPFGTFQEWIGKLGRKIFKKKYNHFLPVKIDRVLRYLRYVVLALVIWNTATTAKLIFQSYDPYFALFNFWTNEVAVSAYIILGVTMLLSLFVERPFCKYACPYGATLGVFNLFRVFKIKRKADTCINCKLCTKECPMNIDVAAKGRVLDHQCISCLKCTSENKCPVKKTVSFGVKPVIIAISIAVLVFGGTMLSQALGLWQTTTTKVPITYKDGAFAGQYNPADIRGSYTFTEIADLFDIPVATLGEAFAVTGTDNYASMKVSQLETIYAALAETGVEVGTDSMRYFVAYYKGLPMDEPEGVSFLQPAADILIANGVMNDAQKAYVTAHSAAVPEVLPESTVAPAASGPAVGTIVGKTTFGDLVTWGMSKSAIEKVLNATVPDISQKIKDYCAANGLDFEATKTLLQEALAAK